MKGDRPLHVARAIARSASGQPGDGSGGATGDARSARTFRRLEHPPSLRVRAV